MMITPAFAILVALLSQANQELVNPSLPTTITIRLLDGRNGKPIRTDEVQVWIDQDQRHVLTIHAAPNGVATVEIPTGVSAIYVTARRDGWYMYRCDADESKPTPPYALEEIMKSGTVAANRCSHQTAAAESGGLTVFLRPLTFWDKMKS
jgi:hypothetical protein